MVWCSRIPVCRKTAAYGFTPDTILLHPDRRGVYANGHEHSEQCRQIDLPWLHRDKSSISRLGWIKNNLMRLHK